MTSVKRPGKVTGCLREITFCSKCYKNKKSMVLISRGPISRFTFLLTLKPGLRYYLMQLFWDC